MTVPIPTGEPVELRAGDTWVWQRCNLVAQYPAPTWTLKYRFKHPSNPGFEVVAAASGVNFLVSVLAATTAGYVSGRYTWIAWVESGAEKYTIGEGEMLVRPDYRAAGASTTLDDRALARKMVEQLEAALLTFNSSNGRVTSYQIADRHMTFATSSDIKNELNYWRGRMKSDEAEDNINSGKQGGRRLLVRL